MNKEVLAAKQAIIDEIIKNLDECGSLTVVSYHGLTVQETTELRRTLAKKGAHMTVYKNSLVERALEAKGSSALKEYLEGPNAFVFSKEISDGPAVLRKFARHHDALEIKGGFVEGKAYDAKGMRDFATMPNKEGLLSMFCQCLNAPVRKFAVAVNAIAEKAAPASEAAPAA